MTQNSDGTPVRCPHCGSQQRRSDFVVCWLCEQPLASPPVGVPPFAAMPERPPRAFSFSLTTLLLWMTLASVGMGLLAVFPGLGIFACVVMVPVCIRTMRVVRYRESVGQAVSGSEKIMLFLGSFIASGVLVLVVGVAAFCSFCGVCLAMVSVDQEPDLFPLAMGIGAVAAVAMAVAVPLFNWQRRRYRRALGEE